MWNDLVQLQNLQPEKIPFQQYLIGLKPQIKLPSYLALNNNVQLKLTNDSHQALFVSASQPNWQLTQLFPTLDSSQEKALRHILTKEVALVQGPPGTGKTYCLRLDTWGPWPASFCWRTK